MKCRASRTFRLKSFSEERLVKTVEGNLECLEKIINYNIDNNILFLRITSDLIPFASHQINSFQWQEKFSTKFKEIGRKIKEADMRISMHPGQYTVLNSNKELVSKKAIKELSYHADVLDLLGLDNSAKINIHVGGVYGDKKAAMDRFIRRYKKLPKKIKKRLIIENDEKSYSVSDCLYISKKTGIPVTFDNLHHQINNEEEDIERLLEEVFQSWDKEDGLPIVHYSSQKKDERSGRHADHLDGEDLKKFLKETTEFNFDLMLEIKDKEKSAKKALKIIKDLEIKK
jgi:UV DNA damage endonuclease